MPEIRPLEEQKSIVLKWGVVALLPVAVWFFCLRAGIAQNQGAFYSLTSAALAAWALGVMSEVLVAVALPGLYILFSVGAPKEMLESWTSSIGWLLLGSLMLGAAMIRTGLAGRIAVWAMYVTRGSFTRLLWGILMAGILLAPCSPSPTGKGAILVVICAGICQALGLKRHSREAAAVLMAGFMAVSASRLIFLTAGSDVILYTRLFTEATGTAISWTGYLIHNGIPAIIYSILSLAAVLLVLRPRPALGAREYIDAQHAALPAVSSDEIKAMAFILLMIAVFITESLHKLDSGWLLLLLGVATALPGIRLTTNETVEKLPYGAVFFVVGSMCIGSAAKATGAGQSLAGLIMPFLGGSDLYMLVSTYVAGSLLNFLLTPLAALAALTVPLADMAVGFGANPLPVAYAFSYGTDQYLFPYEISALLLFYSSGWASIKQIAAVLALRFFLGLVFLMVVAYPWWRMCGLFN